MGRELCRRGTLARKSGAATILLSTLLLGVIFSLSASGQSKSTQENVSGKELFQQHCASCHFATTTAQKIGPGMKGMYARPFSDGKKVTDAGLAKWIEAGGKNMPGFKDDLKPEQIRALISYIKTL